MSCIGSRLIITKRGYHNQKRYPSAWSSTSRPRDVTRYKDCVQHMAPQLEFEADSSSRTRPVQPEDFPRERGQ